MDVRLPDGRIIKNVPPGTTKAELMAKLGGGASVPTPQTAPSEGPQQDSFLDDALDVAGEYAAAANRAVTGTIDLPINAINAGFRLGGVDAQLPTLTGALEGTGIQGGFMDPGTARDAVRAAGIVTPTAAALTQVPRNLATTGGAAAEWLGIGTAAPQGAAVRAGAMIEPSVDTQRKLALLRQTEDASLTPGYKLQTEPSGVSRVVKAPEQRAVMKQDKLPERVVAQFQSSSPADQAVTRQMMDMLEYGIKKKSWGDLNPPRMVLGGSMEKRLDPLRAANREAGTRINQLSNQLRNMELDPVSYRSEVVDPALRTIIDDFDVVIGPDGLDFSQSIFKRNSTAQKAVEETLQTLTEVPTGPGKAYEIQKAKRILDDMIDYDGMPEGMVQRVQNFVKSSRAGLNEYLRPRAPELAEANKLFSDTKEVIDLGQKLVGKNRPMDSQTLGLAARNAVNNTKNATDTRRFLELLDERTADLGLQFDDSLQNQVSIVQSLEEMFREAKPPASFGGEIGKALRAEDIANPGRGLQERAIEGAVELADRMIGDGTNKEVQKSLERLERLRALIP